jgi:hypothetical protein
MDLSFCTALASGADSGRARSAAEFSVMRVARSSHAARLASLGARERKATSNMAVAAAAAGEACSSGMRSSLLKSSNESDPSVAARAASAARAGA